MFLRIDKLQIELPRPAQANPEAAGVVQELLGGKFGEMSTLMNYTYQSFNMRGKSKIRPYYDLVADIAAEEMGHIELVANTINLLLDQTEASTDGVSPPLNFGGMTGNPDHFLNFGLGTIPGGAAGKAWTGENVFNSGNLKLDLLHNFFLESGARMGKIRVYEATQNPVAREMVGYLIVRGAVLVYGMRYASRSRSSGAGSRRGWPRRSVILRAGRNGKTSRAVKYSRGARDARLRAD